MGNCPIRTPIIHRSYLNMITTKINVSDCCKAGLIEDFKNNPRDHHDPFEIYICEKCKQECEEIDVCEICLDTGKYEEEDGYTKVCPHVDTEEADMSGSTEGER